MDAREKEILQLQKEGLDRGDIANKYYNGANKNNLKCLNKYMQRRGYAVVHGKYAKENIDVIQAKKTDVLQKETTAIQTKDRQNQKEEDVLQKYEDRLQALEQKYNQLENILRSCSEVASVDTSEQLKIDLPQADYTKMSSWVNSQVWEEWKKFSDKHEHYGKKYLVSQALSDFINRHR